MGDPGIRSARRGEKVVELCTKKKVSGHVQSGGLEWSRLFEKKL